MRIEENIERVRQHFNDYPHDPLRKSGLSLKKSTIHRILKKDLHRHPYKIQLLQALSNTDHATRLEFAESMIERLEESPELLENLLFSNEAHCHLNGEVNR